MSFVKNNPYNVESDYDVDYKAWKATPTPLTTSNLLKKVQPEIDKGIARHVGAGNPNLRSHGRRLALQAIKTYDPAQAKLGTHIINQLQGLKRISRRQTQVLRIPERVAMDKSLIDRAITELNDDLGRDPNATEIADFTGLSIKRLQHVKKFQYPVATGTLDVGNRETESTGFQPTVEQHGDDPWLEIVYDDLDNINKKIMEWTLGLHGEAPMSNQDIARRLRLSPGAISQRKAVIQSLVDSGTNLSPL